MNLLGPRLGRTQRLYWSLEMNGSFALVDGNIETYVREWNPQTQGKLTWHTSGPASGKGNPNANAF